MTIATDLLKTKAANKVIQDKITCNNNNEGTSDSLLGSTYMKIAEIIELWTQDELLA